MLPGRPMRHIIILLDTMTDMPVLGLLASQNCLRTCYLGGDDDRVCGVLADPTIE